MPDKLETLGGSLIQHGPENDRVYLMKAAVKDGPSLPGQLEDLAAREGYSKIFAKIPGQLKTLFQHAGYRQEAHIPGYYRGVEPCHFMSRFRSEERSISRDRKVTEKVLHHALNTAVLNGLPGPVPKGHVLQQMTPQDVEEMAAIYRHVFASYPFPIHAPAYLLETMKTHVRYFGVRQGETLIALASCEMDLDALAVEMTDFATLPSCRGKGLAVKLLYEMEQQMRTQGLKTACTIARAVSHGMNITFAKMGYQYTGTLVNNTQISGAMESMNIWHKPLLQL